MHINLWNVVRASRRVLVNRRQSRPSRRPLFVNVFMRTVSAGARAGRGDSYLIERRRRRDATAQDPRLFERTSNWVPLTKAITESPDPSPRNTIKPTSVTDKHYLIVLTTIYK